MAQSELRLLKAVAIHWPAEEVHRIADYTRGIYFLYLKKGRYMNVVYVGRAVRGGIKGRIRSHARSKFGGWTHFSAYEVHDNVVGPEIEEIEAFFLTAYAKDRHANKLNVHKGNKKLKSIRVHPKSGWPT